MPIFNEEKNITSTITQLFQILTKFKTFLFEIIAVNDGSTDKSLEILKKYKIKIINHPKRQGYGASLKDGIENSSYNDIIILDADGSYPASQLYQIIKYNGPDSLIIGSRTNYFSLIRHFINKILALLASLLFQRWITDLNSGMRLFKKQIIQQLNYLTWPNGFSFTTTMTLSCIITNNMVKEISIRCESRKGESKAIIHQLGFNILKIIFRFFKLKYEKRTNFV